MEIDIEEIKSSAKSCIEIGIQCPYNQLRTDKPVDYSKIRNFADIAAMGILNDLSDRFNEVQYLDDNDLRDEIVATIREIILQSKANELELIRSIRRKNKTNLL